MKIIELRNYPDERGNLVSFWKNTEYKINFVEDRFSYSTKNVLRGLHGDSTTWKLIVPVYGEMQVFFVPYNFGITDTVETTEIILNSKEPKGILLPPGYLNGHLCLSEECVFLYKWSNYYKGEDAQVSVRYNDPQLNLDWKIKEPILSKRDSTSPSFDQVVIYE